MVIEIKLNAILALIQLLHLVLLVVKVLILTSEVAPLITHEFCSPSTFDHRIKYTSNRGQTYTKHTIELN